MRLHEQGFNYGLADALRTVNARWADNKSCVKAEESRKGKRPDILIDDKTMGRVAIECEVEGGKDKDAPARLKEDGTDCEAAIAVRIPKNILRDWTQNEVASRLCAGEPLHYAVHQMRDDGEIDRFPNKGWLSGDAADLAALIPWASMPPHKVKRVAEAVVEKIVECADILGAGLNERDAEQLAEHVKPIAGDHPLRTLAVLWLDAFLVQRHLRRMNGPPFPEMPDASAGVDAKFVADGWDKILESNWHSIFRPAVDALRDAAKWGGESGHALVALLEGVSIIERERMGDRVQVGAELFPKLCVDRKESAAFYTTPATAEMLAAMTIRRGDRKDWVCPNGPPLLADFACGTGTLLRAGLRRIMEFHQAEEGSTRSTLGALHQAAMTHKPIPLGAGGVTGADVSPIAAHLTNSTLAVMGMGMPYQDTNIGWLETGRKPHGVPKNMGPGLLTGSLEFLAFNSAYDLFSASGEAAGGVKKHAKRSVSAKPDTVDYVLMNPPYSRTRGGQSAFDIGGMTKKQRDGCQKRWGWLLGKSAALYGMDYPPAKKTAGMAASFLAMARRMARPGGRIGFVLPLTAAFAPSWAQSRKMLREWFKDIIVVGKIGASGGADAMSDDTHMGEMMLVATKRKAPGKMSPVLCASLQRMPLRLGEAGAVGSAVSEAAKTCAEAERAVIRVGDDEIGSVVRFDGDAESPWSHLGALHPELSVAALSLATDGVLKYWGGDSDIPLKCGMTTIQALFRMGPTHHLIGHLPSSNPSVRTGAFTMHPVVSKHDAIGEDRALWNANAKPQRNLLVGPTHKGLPYAAATTQDRAKVRAKMGRLHYARGMRWTSQALLAASTDKPMHGGRSWATLHHEDDSVLCAMSLWFNSTFGMLAHWSQAGRQQIGRASTQINAIQRMPCPNAIALPDTQLRKATKWFVKIGKLTLLPAREADVDPVRRMLDEAVVDVFDLPSKAMEIVDAWRGLWVAEPTVNGGRVKT